MHGIIFLQLEKFAQETFGREKWKSYLAEAGFDNFRFTAGKVYDDEQLFALVGLASQRLGASIDDVVESFGRFIAAELLRLYNRVVKPEWTTLDIIENTESLIHSAVRVANPGAHPPILDVVRISETELSLIYSSERKLCKLAIGIVKGIAEHLDESVVISKESCMLQGDPFCSFHISTELTKSVTKQYSVENTLEVSLDLDESLDFEIGDAMLIEKRNEWERFVDPATIKSDFGVFGPYRLLTQKGGGGMGTVFHAIDTRSDKSVAVKTLHPRLVDDESYRKRFMRESRALQQISSPHVVKVMETGQIEGLPYMVMELLHGSTLSSYLKLYQGLPVHEILRITLETVRGLAAVHARKLIHRDLKLENLWVQQRSLRILILDFGLAHNVAEDMRLTRTGMFIGTPAFMAPEQISGMDFDHRADLFSLGCILYKLITGVQPFERKSVMATLMALANDTPKPPAEILVDVPVNLSELTMRLIEKKPENRPADCQEVEKELIDILGKLN